MTLAVDTIMPTVSLDITSTNALADGVWQRDEGVMAGTANDDHQVKEVALCVTDETNPEQCSTLDVVNGVWTFGIESTLYDHISHMKRLMIRVICLPPNPLPSTT